MGTRRSLVAAIAAVALLVPLGSAIADRGPGHGHGGDHGHHDKRFNALIFSKTAAFRHTQCIPSATVALAQRRSTRLRGRRHRGRVAVHRRQPRPVRRRDLPVHDGRRAQRDPAGGVRALHPGRRRLRRHPLGVRHRVRLGVVRRAGRRVLPRPPGRARRERAVPGREHERGGPPQRGDQAPTAPLDARGGVVQLPHQPAGAPSTCCCRSTRARTTRAATACPGGSPPMGDHPIAWCQPYDGGRAFYTALGHKGDYWDEPLLLSHVLGGIEMAAGVTTLRLRRGGLTHRVRGERRAPPRAQFISACLTSASTASTTSVTRRHTSMPGRGTDPRDSPRPPTTKRAVGQARCASCDRDQQLVAPAGHRRAQADDRRPVAHGRRGERDRRDVGAEHHDVVARVAQQVVGHPQRDDVELAGGRGEQHPVFARASARAAAPHAGAPARAARSRSRGARRRR